MAIAVYARKSIERENSISCETQIEYCRMMIKPDEKSEKVITFVDNGFSGGNTDREGFQQMMKQIERGSIRKVIVYRLDRISRSLSDFVSILDTLKDANPEGVFEEHGQTRFHCSGLHAAVHDGSILLFGNHGRSDLCQQRSLDFTLFGVLPSGLFDQLQSWHSHN